MFSRLLVVCSAVAAALFALGGTQWAIPLHSLPLAVAIARAIESAIGAKSEVASVVADTVVVFGPTSYQTPEIIETYSFNDFNLTVQAGRRWTRFRRPCRTS